MRSGDCLPLAVLPGGASELCAATPLSPALPARLPSHCAPGRGLKRRGHARHWCCFTFHMQGASRRAARPEGDAPAGGVWAFIRGRPAACEGCRSTPAAAPARRCQRQQYGGGSAGLRLHPGGACSAREAHAQVRAQARQGTLMPPPPPAVRGSGAGKCGPGVLGSSRGMRWGLFARVVKRGAIERPRARAGAADSAGRGAHALSEARRLINNNGVGLMHSRGRIYMIVAPLACAARTR